MTTLFEKIINKEIPAEIVYQDDRAIAFRDINPKAPVHILIVTKKVIPSVDDISDEDEPLVGHLFTVARDLARQEGIAEDGYRLIVNCKDDGGQEIYHLHMHLLGGQPIGPMVIG
ncbi:MAG: histidine triad nucleotide-binding protein [Gammaproteobacteria bacterium]